MPSSTSPTARDCFVIMPISDPDGYMPGHFQRVYQHAIKPAIAASGYTAIRADDVRNTNFIVVDILQRVISATLAVCDLSAQNPNVFFELGIRQAFDMPVVLIKDSRTDRTFDIQGLRTIEYDESLRIDAVADFQERLRAAITETMTATETSINSLLRLLSLRPAEVRAPLALSQGTTLLLSEIREISSRLHSLERNTKLYEWGQPSVYGPSMTRLELLLPAQVHALLRETARQEAFALIELVRFLLTYYVSEHDSDHFDTLPDLLPSDESTGLTPHVNRDEYASLFTRAHAAKTTVVHYIEKVLTCVATPSNPSLTMAAFRRGTR